MMYVVGLIDKDWGLSRTFVAHTHKEAVDTLNSLGKARQAEHIRGYGVKSTWVDDSYWDDNTTHENEEATYFLGELEEAACLIS